MRDKGEAHYSADLAAMRPDQSERGSYLSIRAGHTDGSTMTSVSELDVALRALPFVVQELVAAKIQTFASHMAIGALCASTKQPILFN